MNTYSRIPKSATQLNRLQQYRLRLLQGQIIAQTEGDAHAAEAGRGDLDVGERESLWHFRYVSLRSFVEVIYFM
jgi:hypothetical protein